MASPPALFAASDAARGFLGELRRQDTLVFYCPDGEDHYPTGLIFNWQRGHGASISPNIAVARLPPPDLTAYHRSLGLGPAQVFCPRDCGRAPIAEAMLRDPRLMEQISADGSLRRVCFAYKDQRSALLAERLGLEPVCCAPPVAAYESLNDKLNLAAAGRTHGFSTLPVQAASDTTTLDAVFRSLNGLHGRGCMLRLRRGTSGRKLRHARTISQARVIWKRLRPQGDVLVTPFVPPERIIRNLALHGISTSEGFEPVALTDQIIRHNSFRGGRAVLSMESGDLEAVRACLPGLGSWLRAEGFLHAPAGVDGFLMDTPNGRRFVIIDPNIRMTGSIRPWSVATTLAEKAGRVFVWQLEWFAFFGSVLTLGDLRGRLGTDLLHPDHLDRGGILPSCMGPFGFRPLGMLVIEVILLGRDVEHLQHLRRRALGIGLSPRLARE